MKYTETERSPLWMPGETLPPVGAECEYETTFFTIGTIKTGRCKVIAYYGNKVWVDIAGQTEFVISLDVIKFRPLKTERERVIEAAMRVGGLRKRHGAKEIYGSLYDAGMLVIPEGEKCDHLALHLSRPAKERHCPQAPDEWGAPIEPDERLIRALGLEGIKTPKPITK